MDYTIFFHVGICWNNMALSYFSGLTSFFPRTNRAVGLLPNMQMTLFSSFFDYDIYLICDSYVLIFKIRVRDGSDLRFMNLNIIVRSSCRELFIGHISVRCTKVAFTTFEWIGLIIILIDFFYRSRAPYFIHMKISFLVFRLCPHCLKFVSCSFSEVE